MYYLDATNLINDNELKKIALSIKKGKLALFPTETVYGIGTNGLDQNAVKKIYDIKGRNFNNPINLLVNSMEMVEMLAQNITNLEYKLMKAFFPGPFTLILKKKPIVPSIITAGSDTVGIRMPNNEIAKKLIQYSKVPIAAPSANISGRPSGTKLEDILDDFSDKIDFAINSGATNLGMESTIVKVINNIAHILRPGNITPEQIKKVAGNVIIETSHLPSDHLKHYQLNTRTTLVYSKDKNKMIEKIKSIAKNYKNPIILSFFEDCDYYHTTKIIDIGSKYNLQEVSKNLFSNLKKAEKIKSDIILIEGIKKQGLGLAIMNRLLNVCNGNFIEI